MSSAIIRGLIYYAVIFGLAFVAGVARTLVIAPLLGATVAVLLEVPIIVAASWVGASRLLRGRLFSNLQLVVMGAIAFLLTMLSEVVLARLLRGESVSDWAANVATPLGLVGLAGQIAFGAMPLLVARSGTHR